MKYFFTVHADEPFPYRGASLRPATDEALAWIRRMNPGNIIECDVVRPRSQQHHKLFFALLKIVSDNHPAGASVDTLLDIIKIGIGHSEAIGVPKVGICYVPKSISFASMDKDEFSAFFTRAVDYVVAEILPGIEKEALTNEIFDLAGIPMSLTGEIKE